MPAPDMTPSDEERARVNVILAGRLASNLLDLSDDSFADSLAIVSSVVGLILTGLDTKREREAAAEAIRKNALRFAEGIS